VRTLIVSDLHLGSLTRSDLLRREDVRGELVAALDGADRLVLLGDVLELRHGPLRDAMRAARPVFEDIGRAMAGGELVIVAGNHDHALIEPWLARRGAEAEPPALELEQLLEPDQASPAYERIAEWAAPARIRVAYPGLWLREDVYATHGHYLDSHLTVPTLERLSVGAMSRLLGHPAEGFSSVADYEAVGAPVFAWRDAVARDAETGAALNGLATVGAWQALGGRGRRRAGSATRKRDSLRARLRRRALMIGFPIAVAALNRAGVGPLRATISGSELRRAGLRAMDEVCVRLGLGDAHVVFGHTHRPGPLPADSEQEWRGRAGARLLNAGSWTYASVFLGASAAESPYWPGVCVLVEDDSEPQLLRLLQDYSRDRIRPPRG
jgi:predicted phosphodiesterase